MDLQINWPVPVLDALAAAGFEADQRLQRALSFAPSGYISDAQLFHSLYLQNSLVTRYLEIPPHGFDHLKVRATRTIDPSSVRAGPFLQKTLTRAMVLAGKRRSLGVQDYYRAVIGYADEFGDEFMKRPGSLDLLMHAVGNDATKPLSTAPAVREILRALERSANACEDYQYLMAWSGDVIVFRPTSVLGDYVHAARQAARPNRALLTHFRDNFGGFSVDEVAELEQLVNARTTENDFQRFFEAHPHFLRFRDHREVYSHVVLAPHNQRGELVPDFLLTDRELQRAAIVELKLPGAKLVRRQTNRERFGTAIVEARAQLMRYRDWFRDTANRKMLAKLVGMEIYEPDLVVIIGRASEFRDELDRQRLRSDNPDIEVVTYDDIVRYASRRRLIIAGE